jgi:PAS domain S-box-containing protein
MGSLAAPKRSPMRLSIALALQLAFVAADIAITSSKLTVTGTVLLVPLVLAIVGHEREVLVTGLVAVAAAIGATWWNDPTSTEQAIYRILLYLFFCGLAVLAARARERATALASANQDLASELHGTQARLDGILGSLGEAVTVHDERGKTIYVNEAAVRLLGSETIADVLEAEPGELAQRFDITREDGTPVQLADLPGRRLVAGEEGPSLLTRSVRRDTGEAMWLLTKATLYTDPTGERLAINIIEDVTEAKDAARLRADARARGAHDRARPGRLVRHRDGRRDRRVAPGGGRPRRPGQGPARPRPAAPLPAGPRLPERRPGDPARRPG